jgi:hypothetical protein
MCLPPTKTLALTLSQTRWCTLPPPLLSLSHLKLNPVVHTIYTIYHYLPLPVAKYCSKYRRDGARYEHHYLLHRSHI